MFSWRNKKKYYSDTTFCLENIIIWYDHNILLYIKAPNYEIGQVFQTRATDSFLIFTLKEMLYVLIRSASLRTSNEYQNTFFFFFVEK